MNFKAFFQYGMLFTAAITALATSSVSDSLRQGTYHVTSDCPSSLSEGTLNWNYNETYAADESQGIRIVPGAMAFGFPSERFEVSSSSENNISVKNDARHCRGVVEAAFAMFLCEDVASETLACTITLDGD